MAPKAIEIVTVLGDSVVDVSYCTEPRRSRAPRVLAVLALASLLGAATAFGASVVTAASNEVAFDAWTGARRPAYAFRPAQVSPLLPVFVFGGLGLGLCAVTAVLLCRRRERAPELAGAVVTYDELVALTGTLEKGPATYVIRSVDAPAVTVPPPRPSLRPIAYGVGALLAHLAIVHLMSQVTVEADPVSISRAPLYFVTADQVEAAPGERSPPPEASEHAETWMPAMEVDRSYQHQNDRPRSISSRPVIDPEAARARAIEEARNAGILGGEAMMDNSFALGFEEHLAMASELTPAKTLVPESYAFGFGRSGFGICGGIHGYGSIGVGVVGALGYGRIGEMPSLRERAHRAAVPQTVAHQPTVSGSFEKPVIRRYIRRQLDRIRYCYEKELMVKPTLEGTVNITFVIAPNGVVTSSVGTGLDDNVASCVAGVIATIQFRISDGPSQVSYPFSFRSAGP